ncbi:ESX-1 secretion-associated protein [Micromonospora sp. CPCC 205539]|uniref:ESX-1 secretion-associated protein n=1 Tax=Micromonospora sp. CPCC 205539 TaxID=3122408 RepID=UPI002FF3C301
MAAAEGFEVTSAALIQHARSVDRIAGEVDTAHNAAAHVVLGAEAYGKLPVCQAIPMFLDLLQERAVAALAAAEESLRSAVGGLESNARAYDEADSGISSGFGGMYR